MKMAPGVSPSRLRSPGFFQAIVIYLASFWVIVKALRVLDGRLGLAPWAVTVAVSVLLVGLLIVVLKAGVPSPEEREKGGRRIDWGRGMAIGVAMIAVFLGAVAVVVLVYGSEVP